MTSRTLVARAAGRAGTITAGAMALIACAGIAVAVHDGNRLKSLDEGAYFDLSGNLAVHGAFAHTNAPDIEGYDPRLPIGELRPTAYRAPGYVWLQAPLRALGGGYVVLRALNFALLALTLWMLYRLLERRAGGAGAVAGVALVLCYPVLFYAAGTLYPQTLAAFLLIAAVRRLDTLAPSSPRAQFAVAGAIWAALVLTVPICVLLVPIAVAWVLWDRRATARQAGVMVLAVAAAAGAWSARNTIALGARTGLGTSSGFNLLVGNGPYVRYDQDTGEVRWPKGVKERVAGKGELERDRILTRAAFEWMRENPGRAVTLYAQKLFYWFAFRNRMASDRAVPGGSGAGPWWVRDLAMHLGYGLLIGILLVRMALVRRHPPTALEVLLLALYLGAALAYALYFTRIRFRLPFDWLLIAADAIFVSRAIAALPAVRRPPA